jgi:hypothetical protein
VIIDNFHVLRSVGRPAKTDSKLIVHADAEEAAPVTSQRFQPIAGRGPEKVERFGSVEHRQLSRRHNCDPGEASATPRLEQFAGIRAPEAPDHATRGV